MLNMITFHYAVLHPTAGLNCFPPILSLALSLFSSSPPCSFDSLNSSLLYIYFLNLNIPVNTNYFREKNTAGLNKPLKDKLGDILHFCCEQMYYTENNILLTHIVYFAYSFVPLNSIVVQNVVLTNLFFYKKNCWHCCLFVKYYSP